MLKVSSVVPIGRLKMSVLVGSTSFLLLNAVSLNAEWVMAGLHGDLEKMTDEGWGGLSNESVL